MFDQPAAETIDEHNQEAPVDCDTINFKKSSMEAVKYAYDIWRRQKVYRKHPEIIVSRQELPDGGYDSYSQMESVYNQIFELGVVKQHESSNKMCVKLSGTSKKKYIFDNSKTVQLAKAFIKYPLVFSRTPQWLYELVKQCMASPDASVRFVNIPTAKYRVINAHIADGYLERGRNIIKVTEKGAEAYTYLVKMSDSFKKWRKQTEELNTYKPVPNRKKKPPKPKAVTFQKSFTVYAHKLETQYKYIEIHGDDNPASKFCNLEVIIDKCKNTKVGKPRRPALNKLLNVLPNTTKEDFVALETLTFSSNHQTAAAIEKIKAAVPAVYFLNSTTRP